MITRKIKVVINDTYGGFSLSEAAIKLFNELSKVYHLMDPNEKIQCNLSGDFARKPIFLRDVPRDNSTLVYVVKTLGEEANGEFSKLRIVEVNINIKILDLNCNGNECVTAETFTNY